MLGDHDSYIEGLDWSDADMFFTENVPQFKNEGKQKQVSPMELFFAKIAALPNRRNPSKPRYTGFGWVLLNQKDRMLANRKRFQS